MGQLHWHTGQERLASRPMPELAIRNRLYLGRGATPNQSLERTPKASTALAYATAAPPFGAAQLNC